MELGLMKVGETTVTPSGAVYLEKLADTLHRVRAYKIIFFDKREKEITYEQYEKISRILTSLDGNSSKFIKFKDGEIVSSSQIASIRPYEYIIDTRKAEL